MDIVRLYQDYSVTFVTEGHKHTRPGWVNTECPWCVGNPGYHLGYDTERNYYYCWRCGWHPITPTLARVLKVKEGVVRELVREYGLFLAKKLHVPKVITPKQTFQLPTGITPLTAPHREYLEGRGFDADRLAQVWGLRSTGPIAKLDGVDYKNRILIPFTWNGQMVTFDTRLPSAHASHEQRYKACPKKYEVIPRKEILYGRQEEWLETGILVEGPTDVWRMGVHSFATSGIQYTPHQLRLIANTFRRVAVMFDGDPQGAAQGHKIVAQLRVRGIDAFQVGITGDPGGLTQTEADYLIKQIMK